MTNAKKRVLNESARNSSRNRRIARFHRNRHRLALHLRIQEVNRAILIPPPAPRHRTAPSSFLLGRHPLPSPPPVAAAVGESSPRFGNLLVGLGP